MPEKIRAAELPYTPMLISYGRRCLNHGSSLIWIAGRSPCFIALDGKMIPFEVRCGAPGLRACRSGRYIAATTYDTGSEFTIAPRADGGGTDVAIVGIIRGPKDQTIGQGSCPPENRVTLFEVLSPSMGTSDSVRREGLSSLVNARGLTLSGSVDSVSGGHPTGH